MSEVRTVGSVAGALGSMAVLPAFEVNVPSSVLAAREALQQILSELAPLQLDAEEVSTVELVMAEVLNNVFEHAYEDGARDGPIIINCKHLADGLHFTVRDNGHEIADGAAALGQTQELNVVVDDLPEGGFGWFLIKNLAKDVRYQRLDDQNQLQLRIAVAYGRTDS